MSYYFNYSLGYKLNDKFYPLGPCDANGKFYSILEQSASFACHLHEDMLPIYKTQVTDELKKAFGSWTESMFVDKPTTDMKYMLVKDLPAGDPVRKGYFLIEDVKRYEADGDTWDLFYDSLTPQVYAEKLKNEIMFGRGPAKFDSEGEEITEHSASEYMYYAFVDKTTDEYAAFVLRRFVDVYEFDVIPEDAEFVILETEG